MKKLTLRTFLLGLLTIQAAFADVRLPNMFSSHMVLQRRKPVPVWGWADPGEKVTVTLTGVGQTKTTKAGKDGKWRVTLDPMEAGGPYQLAIKGKNTVTYDDVLAGEVWVCSGQSNMEWPLEAATNARQEIKVANHPQIRQLLVKKALSLTPKDNIEGEWVVCTPETAPRFTAVGYFFARQLQQELNVPIGLINTSWGGTHSETWTSRQALERDDDLRNVAAKLPASDDEAIQQGKDRLQKLLQEQQNGQLPTPAEELTWAKPEVDVSQWKTMRMPGDWEWAGLPVVDGVVWFRREIDVPVGTKPGSFTMNFGVDDSDSTYVNGQLVGTTKNVGRSRSYVIPEGVIKPGRNVIAIRITDTGGAGGLMGEPDQLRLSGPGVDIPLAGQWQYRIAQFFPSAYKPGPNTFATLLFNAMLNPLIPYAMQGVIWYQGESNASRAYQYRKAFPLMIEDWRQQWGSEFPFLFVQLASFNSANGNSQKGSTWAELREAQTMTLQLPKTGMAVTSDIGESNDIHPKNKQDVGKRLAAEAMRVAYGSGNVSAGPSLDQMTVDGNRAVLTFKNVGSGLMVKDKYGYLKGFELAGADQKFYYAKAEVQGDKVVVYCDSVTTPVAVRYGWADDNGDVNLYNKEGFPAVPFRTDTWPGITEKNRFGM
ncbi:protein of unknown function DUF303 acetylesterase putative [Fibrisoma limi BUZ 3]|uniref:Sialate O-acetylesterase domain-containing protein n=1 Tax=Fibrisoma limi BUZ 3 TaxID=1185876 RepID=I2GMY6_9BACT|nr:sialate O-acetylesterase [Fibrisoma limi]CCH55264.1 protein of unknown function DUF303 acetylesterase putative [Fibrisoma limi BUZ 3]